MSDPRKEFLCPAGKHVISDKYRRWGKESPCQACIKDGILKKPLCEPIDIEPKFDSEGTRRRNTIFKHDAVSLSVRDMVSVGSAVAEAIHNSIVRLAEEFFRSDVFFRLIRSNELAFYQLSNDTDQIYIPGPEAAR